MAVIWLFSNILFFSVWLGRRFTSEVSTERSYNIWSACSRIHKAWIKQEWTPWYIPRCCGEAWSLEGKIYSILEWHLAFLWTFVLDEKNSIIGLQSKGISAGHLILCRTSHFVPCKFISYTVASCQAWRHGQGCRIRPDNCNAMTNHNETWQLLDKLLQNVISCWLCMSSNDCGSHLCI